MKGGRQVGKAPCHALAPDGHSSSQPRLPPPSFDPATGFFPGFPDLHLQTCGAGCS